jgi:hypothetical protein
MRHTASAFSLVLILVSGLTGCGIGTPAKTSNPAAEIRGTVHGGQQPIVGAAIQLWAAGTSTTSAPTPSSLLPPNVTSDSHGEFNITNLYTCPVGDPLVYLTAKGGDALSGTNPAISLTSVLGPCSTLTPSTYIELNEETSVVAINLLAHYMDISGNIGTTTVFSSVTEMAAAFAAASIYVNPSTGSVPGPNLPPGFAINTPLINTAADLMAACINTPSVSGPDNICPQIFADTTTHTNEVLADDQVLASGFTPSDTIQASIILFAGFFLNQAASQSAYTLIPPQPPFLPVLSAAPTPNWAFVNGNFAMSTATTTDDGIVHIPDAPDTMAAFDLAAQDSSATSQTVTLYPEWSPSVLISPVTLCQTNPAGQCLVLPAGSVSFPLGGGNSLATFAIFITDLGPITNNPPLYLNLVDMNDSLLASTAVTLTTN